MTFSPEEFQICTIARLLDQSDIKHIAVGAASPIPGSAALLAQALAPKRLRVSIIHGDSNNPFTDGGRELFDCAGQGRIDVFFLGGVQIDGQANINLVGSGNYPQVDRRFPGSFGSAYMYFVVPKVVLFRLEHTRRVFVPKVDFISAPGVSEPGVERRGGPWVLLTERCLMSFDAKQKCFTLMSVHPGHSVEEVRDNTGFDIIVPQSVPETAVPEASSLTLIRTQIRVEIGKTYPEFISRLGVET